MKPKLKDSGNRSTLFECPECLYKEWIVEKTITDLERDGQLPNCPNCANVKRVLCRQEKWDRRFLKMAKEFGEFSKDPSSQVGAIITKGTRFVCGGFNGLACGVEDKPERLNNRDLKLKMIVHAEINAIIFAKKDLLDHTIYSYPFAPCSICAGAIIQADIKRCVSLVMSEAAKPRWKENMDLAAEEFKEAGVELVLYEQI